MKVDLFFTVIFVVVVSVIIGLNIVILIDKKISSVSVNIPPINIPPQEIVLDVSKVDNKINVCPNVKIVNKEEFTNVDKEEATNVDKEEATNVDKEEATNMDKEKTNDTDSNKSSKQENICKTSYVTADDFGWEAPNRIVSCANSSISDRYIRGDKSLLPSQISCNQPNKLTSENYYKTHYKKQIVPIEDYRIRGYNYSEFSNISGAYETDKRILSQTTKGLKPKDYSSKNLPTGANYAFHNTPAVPMP